MITKYGRNAKNFVDNEINVIGIEISKTTIDIAIQIGNNIKIYNESVTDMPFDDNIYDGIFCYAIIHLLDKNDREDLLKIIIIS